MLIYVVSPAKNRRGTRETIKSLFNGAYRMTNTEISYIEGHVGILIGLL